MQFQQWISERLLTVEVLREHWLCTEAVDDNGYVDFEGFVEYLAVIVRYIDEEKQRKESSKDRHIRYEVVFPHERTLGMLLERHREVRRGGERGAEPEHVEHHKVSLLVEGGSAEQRGVTLHSLLLRINGTDIDEMSFEEVLAMLKNEPRPLTLTLEKVKPAVELTTPAELAAEEQVCRLPLDDTITPPANVSRPAAVAFAAAAAVAAAVRRSRKPSQHKVAPSSPAVDNQHQQPILTTNPNHQST